MINRIPWDTIDHVKTIYPTALFDAWFASLADRMAVRRIQTRIDRAEEGHFGDCKPVGERVSEMRIHHGPGYRVDFTERGNTIIVLLAGGDKASQDREIKRAQSLARELEG